jgi:hypothetical protein
MPPTSDIVNCWRCQKPCRQGSGGYWMCDCTSTPFDPITYLSPEMEEIAAQMSYNLGRTLADLFNQIK